MHILNKFLHHMHGKQKKIQNNSKDVKIMTNHLKNSPTLNSNFDLDNYFFQKNIYYI